MDLFFGLLNEFVRMWITAGVTALLVLVFAGLLAVGFVIAADRFGCVPNRAWIAQQSRDAARRWGERHSYGGE